MEVCVWQVAGGEVPDGLAADRQIEPGEFSVSGDGGGPGVELILAAHFAIAHGGEVPKATVVIKVHGDGGRAILHNWQEWGEGNLTNYILPSPSGRQAMVYHNVFSNSSC